MPEDQKAAQKKRDADPEEDGLELNDGSNAVALRLKKEQIIDTLTDAMKKASLVALRDL